MAFFKKAQEKLAELQESQTDESVARREQLKAHAAAFNEQSRPPRLLYEDAAQYFGGHPNFIEHNKSTAGTIYLTQDGICWVGYPIRMIIPWTWVTGLSLISHKSTSFTQEFIEGLNKGWGQENREYNNVLAVDFVMEGVPYQAYFHFTAGLTRGISAEKAKTFVERTIPFKKFFHAPIETTSTSPTPAPATDLGAVEALERLAKLHQAGHLSTEEYQQLKAKIIQGL